MNNPENGFAAGIVRDINRFAAPAEHAFHAIVAAMDEGLILQNERGEICVVNPAAEKILGIVAAEWIGCPCEDLARAARVIDEDGSEFPRDAHPAMLVSRTGKPQRKVVMGVHRPDGTFVWLSVNAKPLISNEEFASHAVVTTFHEITERKSIEAAKKQYDLMIDTSIDGFWMTDLSGNLLDANAAYANMSGYSVEELVNMHISQLEVQESSPEIVRAHIARIVAQGYERFETRHRRKDGHEIDIEVSVNYMAELQRFFVFCRDISVRKSIENALYFFAQRGWMDNAGNFLDALVRYLGETLDVDYVVIDRLDKDPCIAETVALYAKGEIVPNMRYSLKNTPCENVMGREFCFYPQGIQQMFPDDRMLSEMGVESYAGLPLWDSSGHSIGLIAIMDSRPLSEQAPVFHLLQFMAPRAVAELERLRSERLLREREREFRTLAENMPDIVVRYDRQCRVIYINPAMISNLAVEVLPVLGEAFTETYSCNEAGANIQREVEQVIATGRATEIETSAPHPGGGTRNYHVRYVAERSANGEIIGVLAIGRDITERKRMEEALVSRERELRALAESSPGMMGSFYLRPDGSVCMPYVSRKIRDLFDLTPQDVTADATVLMARTHPDDAKMVQDSIAESARTLTTWHVPYRILHPGKGERWMESNANPEPHPDGGVIWYGYVHDITERKQAERKLFESESRFRTLFESATDCMLILDKEGRIVDINSTGYEMLGYEEQEMLGRRIAEFDTPECAALVADRMAQIVAEGRARFEAAHVRKDGTVMPVEINTKIIYLDGEQRYFSVIRDITERKRLEQQLKLKEFALDHAQESVYLIFNNRFIYVNEEACRSLGYSCDELLDFSPLDIDADMTREDMLLVKEQTLAKGFSTFETRHRRRDGSSFSVEIHASMFEFNGQMMSMTLARDITERKQAERQLRELTALLHTVREEEKAHLAREIHDDLGSTLAALRLKISLLLEFDLSGDMKKTPLFARLESMSPILDSAVASMRRIITDLRPSILDNLGLMAALEWQACEFHKHTGIDCRVVCLCRDDKGCTDCNPCEYTLDKTLSINLFRILQESLTNVVRHSGASRVAVEFQPCDHEIVLSISDNGRGLPEGHVIASTSYGIRGMRERVEQSGGKIEFDKSPGGGFKLMVKLQQPAMSKMS